MICFSLGLFGWVKVVWLSLIEFDYVFIIQFYFCFLLINFICELYVHFVNKKPRQIYRVAAQLKSRSCRLMTNSLTDNPKARHVGSVLSSLCNSLSEGKC